MKKVMISVLTMLSVLLLTACNSEQQEKSSTYSFHGENEYFAISNGTIVLSDSEDKFNGGKIEVIQNEIFEDVVSYSTTFYIMKNGQQRTVMSNSVVDYTEGAVHVEGDLGTICGEGLIIGNKVEDIEELRENLWFELETTDSSGKENVYQVKLRFVE